MKYNQAVEPDSKFDMGNKYQTYYPYISQIAILQLTYDDGALRIDGLDKNESSVIELRFRDVLVTRIIPEEVRLRLLTKIDKKDGSVVTDEESTLIPWVLEEGLNTRDTSLAKHFLVLFGEEIVDVVSLSDPEIIKIKCFE